MNLIKVTGKYKNQTVSDSVRVEEKDTDEGLEVIKKAISLRILGQIKEQIKKSDIEWEVSINKESYLIWSIEHNAWWKPNRNGYTESRSEAGLYSFIEAVKIVEEANIHNKDIPNEAMIKYEV